MTRITQRERVKRHLEQHGSMTNVEAIAMRILRLSERIRELQAQGSAREEHGVYRYTLAAGPKPKLVPMMVMVDGVRMMRLVPRQPIL